MLSAAIRSGVVDRPRHRSFFLASGPDDAPPIVFVHGWPELSLSWRHQLDCFGKLGFRAIAPDMRGYGRSRVHPAIEDYALEHVVADMIDLLDALGCERAVWVGHDWGAPVVWSLASHHPERCHGVAALCVPYLPDGFAPSTILPLSDRRVYPEHAYPAAQWDYQLFYEAAFERACSVFDADPRATVKALFRRGNPAARGTPSRLATVRRDGGWFGGADRAPEVPLDTAVLGEDELEVYAAALESNGFFGPNAWYMNAERNLAHAARAPTRVLRMPVLFLHGAFDTTCETLDSRLAEPMRAHCEDLTEFVVPSGHWMAQECPREVNAALARWMASRLDPLWVPPRPTDPRSDAARANTSPRASTGTPGPTADPGNRRAPAGPSPGP